MIQLNKVSKSFDGVHALDAVSISIQKGSIYGLLGSNGAGKTTVLKLVAGIYRQDLGSVTVNERAIYENPLLKEKVVFIADTPYFFPQYTIIQLAGFYQSVYGNWSNERFRKLGDVFDIDLNKKIHKFSKGIQRQAAFWLALSTMPEVLILDEPMDGLDPVVRKKVKSLLIQDVAEREMTVFISSHNLREIEDICDHVAILHNGSIIIEKDLDDLKSGIHKIQVAFKGDVPESLFSELHILHEEKRGSVFLYIVKGSEAAIFQQLTHHHPLLLDILPLTLEEIFIYEMGDIGYEIKNLLV